jgi:predicted lipase
VIGSVAGASAAGAAIVIDSVIAIENFRPGLDNRNGRCATRTFQLADKDGHHIESQKVYPRLSTIPQYYYFFVVVVIGIISSSSSLLLLCGIRGTQQVEITGGRLQPFLYRRRLG